LDAQLSICIYAKADPIIRSLSQQLGSDRYTCHLFNQHTELLNFIAEHKTDIDCLIIQNTDDELGVLNELYAHGTLLPVVIIEPSQSQNTATDHSNQGLLLNPTQYLYHTGEVRLLGSEIAQISTTIDRAIAKFLKLTPTRPSSDDEIPPSPQDDPPSFLIVQQRRLAEKLQERLGYLGIYYKRNPQDFFRNLSRHDKKTLITELKANYRDIILNYFDTDYPLNQLIDQLVNRAFFADLSVSQILEIHMDLIDQFTQQLKLEGRSEDILLDYRLALIDIIAHLCEMYRRSIPREDIPFEVFSRHG
jgi:circadian clock protein KaiA